MLSLSLNKTNALDLKKKKKKKRLQELDLAPILLYRSAVWSPPLTIMNPMSVFWRRVCRWITHYFTTTNTMCLHREACLPPLPILVRHQRGLAGVTLICSPPEINAASARLPKSVHTFSPHRAPLVARGKITSQPYLFLNLNWRCTVDKVKNSRYRHNAITALANLAVPLVHNAVTLPPISLYLTEYLPPVHGVVPSYARLKLRAKQLLLADWSPTPAPLYYPYLPSMRPHTFMGLGKFVVGRIHQMRSGKSYLIAQPTWDDPDADTSCPLFSEALQTFEHAILSCYSSAHQRSRLLKGVSYMAPEAPLWSYLQLLIPLAEFICNTATGFPPGMPALAPSLHASPLNPHFLCTTLPAPGPQD